MDRAFKYELQGLYRKYESDRENALTHYMKLKQRYLDALDDQQQAEAKLSELEAYLLEQRESGLSIDPAMYQDMLRYWESHKQQCDELAAAASLAGRESDRAFRQYQNSLAQHSALERHRDNSLKSFRQEKAQREQEALDEQVVMRYGWR